MTWVPSDVKWFIATLAVRIDVEEDARTVVHRNTRLIEANDLETAYDRAMSLGHDAEIRYLNPSGKRVTHSFLGIESLGPVYDKLGHGGEFMWTENIGVSEEEIQSLVLPREELVDSNVPSVIDKPDYTSGEILDEVHSRLRPHFRNDEAEDEDVT